MSVPGEQPASGMLEVTFAEAVKMVGREPGGEFRGDLIVCWGMPTRRWQWCRDREKRLSEAMEIHRKMGEEFRVVSDRVEKEARRRSKRWTRVRFATEALPEPKLSEERAEEKREDLRELYSPEEHDIPGELEREAPEIEKDESREEALKALEMEEARGLQAGSPRLQQKGVAQESGVESAVGPAEEIAELPKGQSALSVWLEDYLTAGLAISSVLMLGPDLASALLAPRTFLPVFFLSTQSAFIIGTILGVLTRKYRQRPQTRVEEEPKRAKWEERHE
ncbi:MAG: hypothetical protein OK456_11320 [Thaumarchaeota archaeon]|nr:hypothetical protein [Nitrososphaerota archaeon]